MGVSLRRDGEGKEEEEGENQGSEGEMGWTEAKRHGKVVLVFDDFYWNC